MVGFEINNGSVLVKMHMQGVVVGFEMNTGSVLV